MGRALQKPDALAFAERLNRALDHRGDVPAIANGRGLWLSKRYKVRPPSAHAWLHGDNLAKPELVRAIAEDCGVTYDWLYFGVGDMNPGPIPDLQPSQAARQSDIKLAFRLAAEALGRDLFLPPAQYAELGMLILELLETGMDDAQVLHVARRMATGWGGTEGDRSTQDRDTDPRAAPQR